MNLSEDGIRQLLLTHRVVPVVTLNDRSKALRLGECLLEEGLTLIEVTLRTPEAFRIIEALRHRFPSLAIAAGTVCTVEALREVGQLGVAFAVSPGCSPELLKAAEQMGTPFLPGVATPSEVMQVLGSGRTLMKVFPVTSLGGLSYLRTLGGLFSGASFCPTGGVGRDDLVQYLDLPGVVGVGGSWMCSPSLLAAGDWDAVRGEVRDTLKRVRQWEEVATCR